MALKALMLRRNIEAKAAELEELQAKDAEFQTREADLTASIDEADTVEARAAVEAEIDRYDSELHAHQEVYLRWNAEYEIWHDRFWSAGRSVVQVDAGDQLPLYLHFVAIDLGLA